MLLHLISVHLALDLLQASLVVDPDHLFRPPFFKEDGFRYQYLAPLVARISTTNHLLHEPVEVLLLKLKEIPSGPLHLLVGPDFGHVLAHALYERGPVALLLCSLLSLHSVYFLHLLVA